jgi:hypothetical protein
MSGVWHAYGPSMHRTATATPLQQQHNE